MALTPQQIKQYYATEGKKARPLSPLDWLAQQGQTQTPAQTPMPTPQVQQVQVPQVRPTQQQAIQSVTQAFTPSTPQQVAALQRVQQQFQPVATPTPQQIQVDTVPSGTTTMPELSQPTNDGVTDAYYTSLTEQLSVSQKALEDERNRQLATTKEDRAKAQTELDAIRSQQKTAITDFGTVATEEKQQILDQLEIQTARFDENYKIVQGLGSQLMDLMTQGNTLIAQQKAVTGLASIRNPRVTQTISDVTAAAGVIQAGISVFNGQMNQAQSQLVNATNVITSAYSDQINYYKTLADFYESKASDSNAKLITLTKDEKNFLDAKIVTLENDVERVQKNKDNLIEVMTDPDTALAYAEAGVTLNDSPEQIASKLSKYGYTKEVRATSDEMGGKGYTYLVPGQTAPANAEVITRTDSKGVTRTWWKEAKAEILSPSEAKSLGVPYGTTREGAFGITPRTPSPTETQPGGLSTSTRRILEGQGSLSGLTPSQRQKTEDELFALGLSPYQKDVPQAFKQRMEEELQASLLPSVLKKMWDEYKSKVIGEDRGKDTGGGTGGGIPDFDSY